MILGKLCSVHIVMSIHFPYLLFQSFGKLSSPERSDFLKQKCIRYENFPMLSKEQEIVDMNFPMLLKKQEIMYDLLLRL